jgi:hypothetical protein
MGCAVDADVPRAAAIAGSPPYVLLAGISVCDTSGLVGVSWPEGTVTGVLRNLEVGYLGLAAVPGDSALMVAGGDRPSSPEGGTRLYIVNAGR